MDESGFMLQPVRRRTWALQGHTPQQKVWDRHDRLSVQAAITLPPQRHRLGVYFKVYAHNIGTVEVVAFIAQLMRLVHHKLLLVWDRWSVHRAAATVLQNRYPGKLEIEWLPSYAPELNPTEQVWNHTKYGDLANFIPDDLEHLADAVIVSLKAQHHDNNLIRGYFSHAQLVL